MKKTDGSGVLRCTRADGSVTWQKLEKHAAHFALHDLTHFAVETTLGYRQAFFGLIAAGWDAEETTGKGARGALPEEASEAEKIVGLLDSERALGTPWSLEDFNGYAPRPVSEADLRAVRAARADLFRRWAEIRPGQALELEFRLS